MVSKGDKAPDFTLVGIDENGEEKEFSLADFKGSKIVLYFYPKDSTPGCTVEACDFRDNISKFKKEGATVLGVSPDSVQSHLKFREKQTLNFTLLSDPDKKVAESYGAYGEKKLYGKVSMGIIRSTFIIDDEGKILEAWNKVKVKDHVDDVFNNLT
jgi:peroxiredoxin Q/BCP